MEAWNENSDLNICQLPSARPGLECAATLRIFIVSRWLFYDFLMPHWVLSIWKRGTKMSPAMEKPCLPVNKFANEPAAGEANSKLNIAVIFTSIESTQSALRKAGALANRLRACITLIVPQVVPYRSEEHTS